MLENLSELPLWKDMGVTTLDEMDSVKLLNRIDTKYVMTDEKLSEFLVKLSREGYKVLMTEGRRTAPYDTLYYDTQELKMYNDHQRGKLTRQKVRTRTYLNSGTTFLEIKRKNNHGRTKKKRIEIPREYFGSPGSIAAASDFLKAKSDYEASQLLPCLETKFTRITLVNPEMTERLTIDSGLTFSNIRTGNSAGLSRAVIVELKRDGLAPSRVKDVLLELRIKPLRISKYCIGTALTDPEVKSFKFKDKINYLRKI